MHRRSFLTAVGGLGAATSGCLGVGGAAPDYDIGMRASAFEPQRLEVAAGTTVVWLNTNSRAHTVTAYDQLIPDAAPYFASGGFPDESTAREAFWNRFGGAIPSDETFSYTFEVPGDHRYFCVPHERGGMIGRVVVTE